MKDIYFVYNSKSGSALPLSELKQKCKTAGVSVKKFIAIDRSLSRRLTRPIAAGNIVAVIGGDGTINSIASELVGTQAILAALPGGTFNHFTKDAGIPQDLDEALARLMTAKIRRIDTVHVNGRLVLNNSSLGLYPNSLQARARIEDKLGKFPAMIVGTGRSLFNFHSYIIEIEDEVYRTPFVFIGNNRYKLNDFGLTDRTILDGGEMCLYMAKVHNRRGLIRLFWAALRGRLRNMHELEVFHFKRSVTIKSSRRHMNVSYDGEVTRMATPIIYTPKPKSLRIL